MEPNQANGERITVQVSRYSEKLLQNVAEAEDLRRLLISWKLTTKISTYLQRFSFLIERCPFSFSAQKWSTVQFLL